MWQKKYSNVKKLSVGANLIYEDYSEITLSLSLSLSHESLRLEWPVDANIVLYEWVVESCYIPCVSLLKRCVFRLSFVHACIRAISRQVRAYTWSMFGELTFPTVCITDLFALSSITRMISSRDERHMDTWYLLYCREINASKKRIALSEVILINSVINSSFAFYCDEIA